MRSSHKLVIWISKVAFPVGETIRSTTTQPTPESLFSTDLSSNGGLSWFDQEINEDSYRKIMGRVYLRITSGTGDIKVDFGQDEMSRK